MDAPAPAIAAVNAARPPGRQAARGTWRELQHSPRPHHQPPPGPLWRWTRWARKRALRLAAPLVHSGGFLFAASCSHHVDPTLFAEQVRRGLIDANRSGRILASTGAAKDHPVHPALPESAYLKAQLLQLD